MKKSKVWEHQTRNEIIFIRRYLSKNTPIYVDFLLDITSIFIELAEKNMFKGMNLTNNDLYEDFFLSIDSTVIIIIEKCHNS